MAILNNPEDFISGENVTAAKLNNLVDGATFLGGAGEATDDSTLEVNDGVGGDGSLRVKDLGITTAKLADGAVSTQKMADSAVTFGKIQNISTSKVIGRITAGSGNAEEVSILDQDDMASDSDTALATQQSIKAYVDAQVAANTVSKYSTGWFNNSGAGLSSGSAYTFTHGLGTADLTVSMYLSATGSDSDQVQINLIDRFYISSFRTSGAALTSLSTTQFTVQIGSDSVSYLDSNGDDVSTNLVGDYIKIVAIG